MLFGLVGFVLGWLLTLFILVMIGRMIVDWAVTLEARGDWVWKTRRVTHAVTEPVLSPVRRVLPPLRFGGFGLDLAFTVVFFAALILRSIVW
ncbi:YggT family protein [Lentzea sp. NPDC004782]|jgi:YggT family protein|uniref:YggT family protein n=1 Tax=Lentzea sp. NPDC004782 TaxID=3154458 RepID=UPI00339E1362